MCENAKIWYSALYNEVRPLQLSVKLTTYTKLLPPLKTVCLIAVARYM